MVESYIMKVGQCIHFRLSAHFSKTAFYEGVELAHLNQSLRSVIREEAKEIV